MIRVSGIGFSAGKKTLLEGVSFDLSPGEVLAVCGPNGAGKSTLLKCLSGQLVAGSGTVSVDGEPLSEHPASRAAKWRAVLPQAGAIPFDFSAEEIVLMGRSPHSAGLAPKRDRGIAREALALADATHLASRSVATLSGGELQRVHLARVLAQIWEPVPGCPGRLLLLDEPTSALDLKHQLLVLGVVREWAKRGVAALVILHDLNLAGHFADRVLLLKNGRPAACGSPGDVLVPDVIAGIFGVRAEVLATAGGRRFLAPLKIESGAFETPNQGI